MNNLSVAGIGMYAFVIVSGLRIFGIIADQDTVAAAIAGGIQAISFVAWLVGQLKRKDLKLGLVRKY